MVSDPALVSDPWPSQSWAHHKLEERELVLSYIYISSSKRVVTYLGSLGSSCTLFNVGGKTYKQVVVSHYSFEEETQHWLYRTMEHCAMKQKG